MQNARMNNFSKNRTEFLLRTPHSTRMIPFWISSTILDNNYLIINDQLIAKHLDFTAPTPLQDTYFLEHLHWLLSRFGDLYNFFVAQLCWETLRKIKKQRPNYFCEYNSFFIYFLFIYFLFTYEIHQMTTHK